MNKMYMYLVIYFMLSGVPSNLWSMWFYLWVVGIWKYSKQETKLVQSRCNRTCACVCVCDLLIAYYLGLPPLSFKNICLDKAINYQTNFQFLKKLWCFVRAKNEAWKFNYQRSWSRWNYSTTVKDLEGWHFEH